MKHTPKIISILRGNRHEYLLDLTVLLNRTTHNIYIGTMVAITVICTLYLAKVGYSYYATSLEERFYHPRHDWFKPSGSMGHGLGIAGTLMILFGVSIYIARKRYGFMAKYLRLKYLLEFHIFLCVLGPIFILFHTAFKFGGIVSVAFWSMVAVVLSGVIGRFIYIQIPRTIEGRALTLVEIKSTKKDLSQILEQEYDLDDHTVDLIVELSDQETTASEKNTLRVVHKRLKHEEVKLQDRKMIMRLIKEERTLNRRIKRLELMQRLFKYWHVVHLPFALVMLIIVIVHVAVTLAFGYKWIF